MPAHTDESVADIVVERDRLRAENKRLRVHVSAAKALIAASVRIAEGAADLLIESGTVDKPAPVFHDTAHPSDFAEPGRFGKTEIFGADPRASIPSSRIRD